MHKCERCKCVASRDTRDKRFKANLVINNPEGGLTFAIHKMLCINCYLRLVRFYNNENGE